MVDSWPPDRVLSRSTESSEGRRWRCLGSINVALRPECAPEGSHCSKLSMLGSAWMPQAQFSRKCEDTTSAPGLGQDPRLRRCRTARGSPDSRDPFRTRTQALQGPIAALTSKRRARGCLYVRATSKKNQEAPSRSMSRGDGDGPDTDTEGVGSSWSEAPFYFGRRKRPTVNLDFAFPWISHGERCPKERRRCVAQRFRADECDAERLIGDGTVAVWEPTSRQAPFIGF